MLADSFPAWVKGILTDLYPGPATVPAWVTAALASVGVIIDRPEK